MLHGRVTLFSPRQVGIVTFGGTPLAGLSLIVINYVRIGNHRKAISAFICGIFLLFPLGLISEIALIWVPGPILFLFAVVAMHLLAEKMQGKIFIDNLSNGGKKSGILALWFWAFFIFISLIIFTLSLVYIIDA